MSHCLLSPSIFLSFLPPFLSFFFIFFLFHFASFLFSSFSYLFFSTLDIRVLDQPTAVGECMEEWWMDLCLSISLSLSPFASPVHSPVAIRLSSSLMFYVPSPSKVCSPLSFIYPCSFLLLTLVNRNEKRGSICRFDIVEYCSVSTSFLFFHFLYLLNIIIK